MSIEYPLNLNAKISQTKASSHACHGNVMNKGHLESFHVPRTGGNKLKANLLKTDLQKPSARSFWSPFCRIPLSTNMNLPSMTKNVPLATLCLRFGAWVAPLPRPKHPSKQTPRPKNRVGGRACSGKRCPTPSPLVARPKTPCSRLQQPTVCPRHRRPQTACRPLTVKEA